MYFTKLYTEFIHLINSVFVLHTVCDLLCLSYPMNFAYNSKACVLIFNLCSVFMIFIQTIFGFYVLFYFTNM